MQNCRRQTFGKSKKCDLKNRLTDFNEIWSADAALWPTEPVGHKNQYLKIQYENENRHLSFLNFQKTY